MIFGRWLFISALDSKFIQRSKFIIKITILLLLQCSVLNKAIPLSLSEATASSTPTAGPDLSEAVTYSRLQQACHQFMMY